MTISVSAGGNRLFNFIGNAEAIRGLDKMIREMGRDAGIAPPKGQAPDDAVAYVLEQVLTQAPGARAMLLWMLLSRLTGFDRDYIDAWDFDFDIDASDPKRLSVRVNARNQRGKSLN
jgi:hypothetical protein